MLREYEFIVREEEVYLLTDQTQTISLKEAVGMTAMSTYLDLLNMKKATDADEKKRLEEKIIFQSGVLDSLSSAYKAIR